MSARPLAAFQADFAAALASPDPAARPGALGREAAARFRVYRNNVRHALAEALAAAYPAVARLVGTEFFRAMALAHAAAHPPRARTLALYGEGFADFVAGLEPAAPLPYLPDLARLERAVLEARHAADAAPIDPARVAALGERAAGARFAPHPAARLVVSRWPIVSLWRANRDPCAPPAPTNHRLPERAHGALVTRPDLTVTVTELAPAEAGFAAALLAGEPLQRAAEGAADDPAFDLAAAAHRLLTAGALGDLRDPDPSNPRGTP